MSETTNVAYRLLINARNDTADQAAASLSEIEALTTKLEQERRIHHAKLHELADIDAALAAVEQTLEAMHVTVTESKHTWGGAGIDHVRSAYVAGAAVPE